MKQVSRLNSETHPSMTKPSQSEKSNAVSRALCAVILVAMQQPSKAMVVKLCLHKLVFETCNEDFDRTNVAGDGTNLNQVWCKQWHTAHQKAF